MQTPKQRTNPFTPILTEDPKGRGFSGYFAEFPELFAQGKTRKELQQNLLRSLKDVLKENNQR